MKIRNIFLIILLTLIVISGCSHKSGKRASAKEEGPLKPTAKGSIRHPDNEKQDENNGPQTENDNPTVKLTIEKTDSDNLKVDYKIETTKPESIKKISIIRSTANLDRINPDPVRYPITTFEPEQKKLEGSFIDELAAHNTRYYYALEITDSTGKNGYTPAVSVKSGNIKLPSLSKPSFLIDKVNYFLEVRDGGKAVKRYPAALGRNPMKRKLHQDNSSTPEGRYRIINLQPNAQFYKAYDLNYPIDIDKTRYDFALERDIISKRGGKIPGIGGEIQIHGMTGVRFNGTWGCISLRDEDLDELFRHSEIRAGIPVTIVGREITREDLESIDKERTVAEIRVIQKKLKKAGFNPGEIDGEMGLNTMRAIGDFQIKKGLPLTMQLDARTVEALKNVDLNNTD